MTKEPSLRHAYPGVTKEPSLRHDKRTVPSACLPRRDKRTVPSACLRHGKYIFPLELIPGNRFVEIEALCNKDLHTAEDLVLGLRLNALDTDGDADRTGKLGHHLDEGLRIIILLKFADK